MSTKVRDRKKEYREGVRLGIPIAIGYFVVAFSLGINAKVAGFTAGQAGLASALLMASAGEYALFSLVAAGAGYLEIAVMEFIANARYLLMSCALSQKLDPEAGVAKRLIIGQSLTDEMFGAAIMREGYTTLTFYIGMMTMAIPGWTLGTYLGVTVGNILPANIVTALSVGLYGMFIAIVTPAAKKDKILFGVVLISAICSLLFYLLPIFAVLSEGLKTIILTVVISAAAAFFFPVDDNGRIMKRGEKNAA